MLLAVLIISGTILGATTIAGLLMLYQIRQAGDLTSSAKAIFAADSGTEFALFDFYCEATSTVNPESRCALPREQPVPVLGNGAVVTPTCYDNSGVTEVLCSSTTTAVSAIARGTSQTSKRAFFVDLVGASQVFP